MKVYVNCPDGVAESDKTDTVVIDFGNMDTGLTKAELRAVLTRTFTEVNASVPVTVEFEDEHRPIWTFKVNKVPNVREYRIRFFKDGVYQPKSDYFGTTFKDAVDTGNLDCAKLNAEDKRQPVA